MTGRLIVAACTAAAACVLALAAALLVAVATAGGYLEQAESAQRQSAAVSAIEATVAGIVLRAPHERAAPSASLRRQLADYRRSIAQEPGASLAGRRIEADNAAVLMTIADAAMRAPDTQRALAALDRLSRAVMRIGAAERAEARAVERAMAMLRGRMRWLGIGLALAAVMLGGLAWRTLIGANRRLGSLVAVRTAEADARTARLAEIDRTRRLFFAKLSHELRTPVTVLRGEAEVALRIDDDPEALRGALAHVIASAGFLERRLEELLGLAAAEDGRLTLVAASFDLADTVRQAIATAAPFARSSGIRLDMQVPDHVVMMHGDARWMIQAQLAVLDNAVKFSPDSSVILVRLDVQGEDAVLEFADRGIGIDGIDPACLFEPYHQADTGRARGGVGLGLALTAWIVEQHDGRIAARPREGGGCVIRISVPVSA